MGISVTRSSKETGKQKTGGEKRIATGPHAAPFLATYLTWLQAGRPNHHELLR
jgi:hypothetical protein